jgi:hypothetical protein
MLKKMTQGKPQLSKSMLDRIDRLSTYALLNF